jgi:hypothetical protein
MNPQKPLVTFFSVDADNFLKQLPKVDQQSITGDCDLAEQGLIGFARIKQIAHATTLWELPITVNGHNWCLLAFWDRRYIDTDFLVFTHGFALVNGQIPLREIAKAMAYRQYHFSL